MGQQVFSKVMVYLLNMNVSLVKDEVSISIYLYFLPNLNVFFLKMVDAYNRMFRWVPIITIYNINRFLSKFTVIWKKNDGFRILVKYSEV